MNTHIVRNTGNIASRVPHRSFNFVAAHSLPHPLTSNEKILTADMWRFGRLSQSSHGR